MGRSEGARAAWLKRFPPHPLSRRSPRWRGLVHAAIGLGIAGILYWWGSPVMALVALGFAAAVALTAWLSPERAYARIQRILNRVGQFAGRIVAWLLLVPFFYAVVTPLGLLLRLGRRDPLRRRLDRDAPTYWQNPQNDWSESSYRRQS